jgi:hypothetical protein
MLRLFKLLDRMEVRKEKSCPMIIPQRGQCILFSVVFTLPRLPLDTAAVFGSYSQSTYRGRGEIGAVYLPS